MTIQKSIAFALLLSPAACLFPAAAPAAPVFWNQTGHWYEAVSAPNGITWDEAQTDALVRGGYLATTLSADENNFVFGLVDSASFWVLESSAGNANIGPWIGGYQDSCSPEPACGWTWVNGEGAFSFTNWLGGEPTNGQGSPHGLEESRLHYFTYGSPGATWNDFPSDFSGTTATREPIGYVIEYNQQPVPEPGSLTLLGIAVAGLAATRRRKQ